MPELYIPPPSDPKRSWAGLHLWQIQFVRDAILIALVVGLVMLGYKLSTVTVPMLLAVALAYLFEPVVAKMTRSGFMGRSSAAATIILLAVVLVVAPVTLGAGFGVVQGAKYARALADNIQKTIYSVDNPGDDDARFVLPERGWRWIRDKIVAEKKKERVSRKPGLEAEPDPTKIPLTANPSNTVLSKPEAAAPGAEAGNDAEIGLGADGTAAPETTPAPGTDALGDKGVEIAPGVEFAAGLEPGLVGEEPSDAFQFLRLVGEWLETNASAIGKRALSAGGGAVDAAVSTLGSLFKLGFAAFLTAFFFFFFCTGYGRLLAFWNSLIPQKRRGRVVDLLSQMDEVVAGFVRGRLTICATLIAYYSLAYWLIGVPAALLVGLGVGLLTLVPYAAGAAIPVVMGLMWLDESTGTFRDAWWWVVGAPMVVLAIQQFLDDYVLTPRIQGKTTNMDTPTILFASIAGGVLAGFYGLLLAIPVAACIKILLREVFWPRVRAWIQGRAEDPLPLQSGPKP